MILAKYLGEGTSQKETGCKSGLFSLLVMAFPPHLCTGHLRNDLNKGATH